MLEVCIVGLGALGTIYGYLLDRSGRARVTAVCRSNYDVVKDRGVDIRSDKFGTFNGWKPNRVFKTTAEAADRQYDYVICTAKFIPDLIPTTQLLGPLVSHASTFVLIQNGIGVHVDLQLAVPNVTIISGCAWIDATAINGGTVVQHGRVDRLVLGIHLPPGSGSSQAQSESRASLDLIVELLRAGGGDAILTDHIEADRWSKNIWNIGYSVMCTLTRASVATLLTDKWAPTTTPVIRGFMDESVTIARAAGFTPELLPETAIAQATHLAHDNFAETYAPRTQSPFTPVHYRPSMLVDLDAGRPMEVEGIVGGIVKKAKEVGVSAPRLETAYGTLLLLQEPLLEATRNRISH